MTATSTSDLSAMGNVMNDNKRSEEHTSELQSLMRISYAVFCLKKQQRHTITPPHPLNKVTIQQFPPPLTQINCNNTYLRNPHSPLSRPSHPHQTCVTISIAHVYIHHLASSYHTHDIQTY